MEGLLWLVFFLTKVYVSFIRNLNMRLITQKFEVRSTVNIAI